MADNTARAREQIAGHRRQIRGSVEKWKRYPEPYQKQEQLNTIENVQGHIRKLKDRHPSLKNDEAAEDTWQPGRYL